MESLGGLLLVDQLISVPMWCDDVLCCINWVESSRLLLVKAAAYFTACRKLCTKECEILEGSHYFLR